MSRTYAWDTIYCIIYNLHDCTLSYANQDKAANTFVHVVLVCVRCVRCARDMHSLLMACCASNELNEHDYSSEWCLYAVDLT